MKKVILGAMALSIVSAANAAVIYSRTVETGSRYGGGGANVVTFDDIPISYAAMAGNSNFKLNSVTVGIRRLAGSSANTVSVWAAQMGTSFQALSPVLLGTVNLAARTTSATELVTFSGLTQTITGNLYNITPNWVSMYIGVQQSATDGLQGWRITSGASPSADLFVNHDLSTNVTTAPLAFAAPTPSSFYTVLDATPVPEPGSVVAIAAGLGMLVLRRKKA